MNLLTLAHLIGIIFCCTCCTPKVISTEEGLASYYADFFQGETTASGESYDSAKISAAHRSLPFGTQVRVTNLANKKSLVLNINDRGPFVRDRIIDLSKAAAKELDIIKQGVVKVKLEVLTLPAN